jgi:hypothetical protein
MSGVVCRVGWRVAGFVTALMMAAVATRGAATDPNHLIYSEALEPGWQNASDGTVDFAATDRVYRRRHAITFTTTAGGQAFRLRAAHPIDTSAYTLLSFAAQAGGSGQLYAVHLLDARGVALPGEVALAVPQGTADPDTWKPYDIPLADLGAAHALISGIEIRDLNGRAGLRLYLDELELVRQGKSPQPAKGRKPAGWRDERSLAGGGR